MKVPVSPDEGVVRTRALETTNSRWTESAGAFEESPAWLATIRQVPAVIIETVVPETVQTDRVSTVEVKATVRPRSELAVTVNVFGDLRVWLLSGANVIIWAVRRL